MENLSYTYFLIFLVDIFLVKRSLVDIAYPGQPAECV